MNLLTLAVLGGHHGHSHGGHDHGHGSHGHSGHEHSHDEGVPTSASRLMALLAAHAIISISLLHFCITLSKLKVALLSQGMPGTGRLQRQDLRSSSVMESCRMPGRRICTMHLQGSSPALLYISPPAVCAAAFEISSQRPSLCLQTRTSTTSAQKIRPAQARSCMERLRHQQLNRLMRMGTPMGRLRPQVGLVCLGWRAWLARLQGSCCV